MTEKKYWGIETQQFLDDYSVGDYSETIPCAVISALGLIKKCATKVNMEFGLDKTIGKTIMQAAEEVERGRWIKHFPVTIYQAGNGMQGNINANEVIANRAEEILSYKMKVNPNHDVDKNQSMIDCFGIAMHIASVLEVERKLIPTLTSLNQTLKMKAEKFADVVKLGRMNLEDAFLLTLGQEFASYASQVEEGITRLENAVPKLLEIPIKPQGRFSQLLIEELITQTSYQFCKAKNFLTSVACHDPLVDMSGVLNTIAVSLMKIANDIRFLGSGPRCGFGELILPENEPGSSIMPGKVNPTQCEALTMVCAQVIGNHVTVSIGGSRGNFESNAFKPLIIENVMHSIKILTDSIDSFRTNCIEGIEANEEHIQSQLEASFATLAHCSDSELTTRKTTEQKEIAVEEVIPLKLLKSKKFNVLANDRVGLIQWI